MADNHPDFNTASEQHRWTGSLAELMVRLVERAPKAKGAWDYYVLPGGALVAMKVDAKTFAKVLRISRRAIKDPSEARFTAEVATFAKKMGVEDWLPATVTITRTADEDTYHAEAVLARPFGGKANPLACSNCGNAVEPGSDKYRVLLCNKCALAAGAADTATRQAERAARP